ncbi:Wax ester synthase/acyl-CoA--diacylglycerol acyltransferase [Photobacterium jeanii]|uniref:diacylglycerol O-acyltransferase n=1 Tax=Photobacterium jeanii TaxID=858640 RepID=A0A178KK01_9GAMM|nr:wax ester/triacylglycerol synthase family O-acyltransferase [Photobacterium jeanii]OAN17639.1 Wax ester synthase/acyl-CoA--diacylglycerol acyltransferase [Photobacterium jeanii]PST92704.1 wax ester/triacylglycerol synthase family O-acyltransferase [Photobacterium jeanii]
MPSLSLLDFSFVAFESAKTPLHVSGLIILDPPEKDAGNFAQMVYASFLQQSEASQPFNWKLNWGITGKPRWDVLDHINIEDHIRFTMLPAPGNAEQLQKVAGRIHGQVLDRAKPLWEVWVIDGLENNQVALMMKIHHSVADGIRASSLFTNSCSPDVEESFNRPLWQSDMRKTSAQRRQESHLTDMVMKTVNQASKQVSLLPSMFRLGTKLAMKAVNLGQTDLTLPFSAPKTPFNANPKRNRALSLGEFSISQIKHLRAITGASMNDVLFTVSDIALNRYLKDRSQPINKPLVAMMPINLRNKSEKGHGNKMSIGNVELGRPNLSPLERLEAIQTATNDLKREALAISPDAYVNYSLLVNGISLITGKLGINNYVPTTTNLLISNVPGAKEQLYFMGAKVKKQYPVSVLMPGQTLNITFFSNGDNMYYSLVACNQSLPGFEVIAQYMQEAFEELKQEIFETACFEVAERVEPHDEESLAVEVAVSAAEKALTPEDAEFERILREKQAKVVALEKQLAELTAKLSSQLDIDPDLEAMNQELDDDIAVVTKPKKKLSKAQ